VCDFALSWHIADGSAAGLDLSGLDVVLAGHYVDDRSVAPDATLGEWGVALYVHLAASDAQAGPLEEIFLGTAANAQATAATPNSAATGRARRPGAGGGDR
jgi:hypothetical protein